MDDAAKATSDAQAKIAATQSELNGRLSAAEAAAAGAKSANDAKIGEVKKGAEQAAAVAAEEKAKLLAKVQADGDKAKMDLQSTLDDTKSKAENAVAAAVAQRDAVMGSMTNKLREKEAEADAAKAAAAASKSATLKAASDAKQAVETKAAADLAVAKQKEIDAAAKGKEDIKNQVKAQFGALSGKLLTEKQEMQKAAIKDLGDAVTKSEEVTNIVKAMKAKYEALLAQGSPSLEDEIPELKARLMAAMAQQ